jgi:hypothetical protein
MSTKAELFYSAVHGTAMRYAAERRDLAESIAEIRELADGHDEVLAEAAGISAGSWSLAFHTRRLRNRSCRHDHHGRWP